MEENRDKLTVLTVTALNEALNRYVELSDIDAFKNIVRYNKYNYFLIVFFFN